MQHYQVTLYHFLLTGFPGCTAEVKEWVPFQCEAHFNCLYHAYILKYVLDIDLAACIIRILM